MFDVQPLNHPRGRGAMTTFAAPVAIDAVGQDAVDLKDVQIHTALFEVSYAEVMALLPPSLHPSTPAYGTLNFYKVADSVVGGFEFAVMGIGCRSIIKPRMLTLSAFVSTPAAAALLSSRWGLACQIADVRTHDRYDGTFSEISIDNVVAARIQTIDAEMLHGMSRAIKYAQPLNYVVFGGKAGLLQTDMVYEYRESYRGKLKVEIFDAAIIGQGLIQPTNLVAGTFVRAGVLIKPAKIFMDLQEVGVFTKFEGPNVDAAASTA